MSLHPRFHYWRVEGWGCPADLLKMRMEGRGMRLSGVWMTCVDVTSSVATSVLNSATWQLIPQILAGIAQCCSHVSQTVGWESLEDWKTDLGNFQKCFLHSIYLFTEGRCASMSGALKTACGNWFSAFSTDSMWDWAKVVRLSDKYLSQLGHLLALKRVHKNTYFIF